MSTFAGTGRLIRLLRRTARAQALFAVLVIVGLVTAVMASVQDLYATEQGRAQYAATLGRSPATAAFNGRPFDLDTIGGIAVYEVGFFGLLLLPALVLVLAVRWSRGQEDLGRSELVTSMQVGRMAPLLAAVLTLTSIVVVSGALIYPGVIAAGYESSGTVVYCLALVLFLLVAAAFGFVCAELSQSGRSATILALAGLALMYMIRAVIDGKTWDVSWATPMGWFAEARPYAEAPPAWPLLALAVLAATLFTTAFMIRGRRDLGAGVIPPRRGPAHGRLKSSGALIRHLTAGIALAWAAGALAWGAAIGLLAEEMRTMLESNPALAEALVGQSHTPDGMMTYIVAIFVGLMAAAMGLQGVTRFAAEEIEGRLGVVMSTSVSRARFWAIAVATIAFEVIAVLLAGGIAFELAALATGAEVETVRGNLTTMLAYAAPVAVITAIGLALFAVSPRWAAGGWLVLLWATVVAILGKTLQLPQWARDLSPIEHLGNIPIDPLDTTTWWTLLTIGFLLVIAAVPRLVKRDLSAG